MNSFYLKENLIIKEEYTIYKCTKCEFKTDPGEKDSHTRIRSHYAFNHIESISVPYDTCFMSGKYIDILLEKYILTDSIYAIFNCKTIEEYILICDLYYIEELTKQKAFSTFKSGWYFIIKPSTSNTNLIYKFEYINVYINELKSKLNKFEALKALTAKEAAE